MPVQPRRRQAARVQHAAPGGRQLLAAHAGGEALGVLNHPTARPFAGALFIGLLSALACLWLDTPLPWLIGPLFGTAFACMFGARLAAPVRAREAGQWAIGTALGLYFSAPVLAVLGRYAGWIVLSVAFALALGAAGAWLLRRLTGLDPATAFFAMAAGGASEMAVQGERHGALVERVAAAHSLRIMLVTGTIPFAVRALHSQAALPPFLPAAREVWYPGLAVLALVTSCGALLLKRRGIPNAWVIGPLAVALVLTACGVQLSRLPEWAIRTGQLLIGVSLGTRFTPAFVRSAPRFLGAVAVCTAAALALAAGFACAVAHAAGLPWATALLATSPGGIAEMALTARVLNLGVPVVTAFHVARMVVVVLVIGPAYRLLARTR